MDKLPFSHFLLFSHFIITRQLEAAISSQLEVNLTLEQDRMDGVDASEWVRIENENEFSLTARQLNFMSHLSNIFYLFIDRIIKSGIVLQQDGCGDQRKLKRN